MKVYALEEERELLSKFERFSICKYIKKADINSLICEVLFVVNKDNLKDYIKDIDYHLLETEDIKYIIINDNSLFDLIVANLDKIICTKIEESWFGSSKKKKLFRFFRVDNKKMFTVIKNFEKFYFVLDSNGDHTTFDDKKVSKYYNYYDESKKHYEKDINTMTRYALEQTKRGRLKIGKNYRICNFDIETNASVDAVETPGEILSIVAHDSLTDKVTYWEIRELEEVEERKMLEKFFKYVSDFDIITGFNIDKFDIPYLLNRAKKVGVDTSLITGIKGVSPSSKFRGKDAPFPWFNVIPGINIIDLIGLAEKSIGYLDIKLPDKKLDTLGKYILGERKVETDTPAILFKNKEFDKLKEYNIQDVNIAVKLDKKLGLIEVLFATIELVPGLNLDAAVWNSKIIDFYLLSKFNMVLPSINRDREKDIKGAIVFDSVAGIHDNVAIYDVGGMYPSLIRSLNISPETKNKDGDIKIGDISFTSAKKGILSKFVDEFTALRAHYKKLLKEDEKNKDYKLIQLKEFTIKKVLASTYGVFGFIGFRFFDNDIANSITRSGRDLLTFMRDVAIEEGYTVLSGDSVDKKSIIKIALPERKENNWFISNGRRYHFNSIYKKITIENLFNNYKQDKIYVGDKEIIDLSKKNIYTNTLNKTGHITNSTISKIIRHKTNKKRFRITTATGKQVIVTEDHSCIVNRNGKRIVIKPKEIDIKKDKVYTAGNYNWKIFRKINKIISNKNKNKIPWNKNMKPKDFMKYNYDSWLDRKQDFSKMTIEENIANNILKKYNFKFNFVYGVPRKINGSGHYRLDFVNLKNKIIVEIDGSEHRNREKVILKDKIRDKYFKSLGFKIYRIKNKFVKEELNKIVIQWKK